MRDRLGRTIHTNDRLRVQTVDQGPVGLGRAEDTKHGYCKDLGLVLVRFDNRTAQYMDPKYLEVCYQNGQEICLAVAKSPAAERGVCPCCHGETKPGEQLYEDGSCWPQCLGS